MPVLARRAGGQINVEKFAGVVLTEIRGSEKLMKCSWESLLASMIKAVQLGLEFGPLGHCYLVPYKTEATFILGYTGMIELALRSGKILSFDAAAVHENDAFDYELGLEPYLRHKPARGERGEPTDYYVIARYADTRMKDKFDVRSREWVEARRQRSKAKDSGPWTTDYEAMALKSVLRGMRTWLPLTVEARRAFAEDQAVDEGYGAPDNATLASAAELVALEPADTLQDGAGAPQTDSLEPGSRESAQDAQDRTADDEGPDESEPEGELPL
jgi:recombination protein RecT